MKLWALLGQAPARRELDLEVQMEDGRLLLETGEGALRADVASLPDGEAYSLLVDGRSYEVAVEEEGATLRVTWKGKSFRVSVRNPLEKVLREVRHAAPTSAAAVLLAPMPGLVVSIQAGVGDAVRPGQAVLVVEAMKMQNELSAEAAGVVQAVHVSPGQPVEAGQPLVTIGPAASEGA